MNLNLLFNRGRLAHNYFLNFLVLSTGNLINRVPGCKQKTMEWLRQIIETKSKSFQNKNKGIHWFQ